MGNKKKLYRILAIVALIMISGLALGVRHYYKLKNPQDLFTPEEGDRNKDDELDIDINAQFDKDLVNILIVGFDKNEGRSKTENVFRTDTNILASINLREKTVDMLSIPRDTYVTIAHMNGKKDKFNSAFVHGYLRGGGPNRSKDGYRYLLDTSRDLLGGIPINYYLAVDMDVVVEVVDAIGGVDIYIPQDVISRSKKVAIEKGNHTLNGKDLMYYARNRQLRDGDIDRVKNQQRIIKAIFNTLKKSNKFTALPKIYKSVMDNIETNMNFNQISALALFGMELDMNNMETHMLEGSFGHFNNLAYWIIDQEARVDLLENLFGIRVDQLPQDPTEEVVTALNISASKTRLNIGDQARISARGATNINPSKVFRAQDLRFSSSNKDVVDVDGNGILRAIGPGEATITVSSGNISRSISLLVNKPPIENEEKNNQDKDPDQGKDPDGGKKPDQDKDLDEDKKPDQGKDPEKEKDPDEGKKPDQGKDSDEGKKPDQGKGPDEENKTDKGQDRKDQERQKKS